MGGTAQRAATRLYQGTALAVPKKTNDNAALAADRTPPSFRHNVLQQLLRKILRQLPRPIERRLLASQQRDLYLAILPPFRMPTHQPKETFRRPRLRERWHDQCF